MTATWKQRRKGRMRGGMQGRREGHEEGNKDGRAKATSKGRRKEARRKDGRKVIKSMHGRIQPFAKLAPRTNEDANTPNNECCDHAPC